MHRPDHFGEFATLLREIIHFSCDNATVPGCQHGFEKAFDRLAVSLFRLQFAHNAAYRRLCKTRNLTPRQVAHWNQIPSVHASAFKEMDLSCLDPEERTTVFHSSGTTGQRPGRHFHGIASLRVYEASLCPWFAAHLMPSLGATAPSNARIPSWLVMLTPPPAEVPNSSLVHMFATIGRRWKWNESHFVGKLDRKGSWMLDSEATIACLQRATELGQAAMILGTAFSFVHLLDHLQEVGWVLRLPAGSRVMETGGYKGRSRALSRPELRTLISQHLGIPAQNIVCEYGMSELSSQAYDHVTTGEGVTRSSTTPVGCRFRFPPWARAQVISPETGREVDEGETGLIRVFDLANVYSALAIQTEDLAIRRGSEFELIGRAQAAEPRGCSLAAA